MNPSDIGPILRFLIVGIQKSGTTTLSNLLSQHPQLQEPDTKELHFFDDETIDWRTPDYSRLHSHFRETHERKAAYEATPAYIFWPNALERIQAYNPDIKLICIYRDPIDRAWSHWRMQRKRGIESLNFGDAIRQEETRLARLPGGDPGHRSFSYVARGFYFQQTQRMFSLFPRRNLLLLRFADLSNNQTLILDKVAAFLEIDEFPPTLHRNDHIGSEEFGIMPERDRLFLANVFREDTRSFSSLTNLDVSHWSGAS